ncbi:MAG: hypothetical protein HY532_07440 [Chloroflexi bacterium]|nr:hypothetical protein [Chloroflexota bacterium]
MVKPGVLITVLVLFLALLGPGIALAQQPMPELVVGFSPEATTGERLVVAAYLLDPFGNPISGQTVSFSTDVDFLNIEGSIEIGRAVTDDQGLAYFLYIPKSVGERTITASFAGNSVFAPTSASAPLTVLEGSATYMEEYPFRIPGADIRLVVFALAVVWGLFLFVTVLFWLIRRAGEETSSVSGGSA